MEAQQQDRFRQYVRRYLLVFYVVLFGTLSTVGASHIINRSTSSSNSKAALLPTGP
jgi:hypothetical protein